MLASFTRATTIVALVGMLGSIDGCLPSGETATPEQPETATEGTGTGTGTGTVVSVTDGDTLRLEVGEAEFRVRLIGVDTPEVFPDEQCYGPEAESALAALAPPGSTIGYAYDRDARDRFDRELMYLFTADGTSINLELVAQGFGEAVLFEPNDLYWNDLQAAERAAQNAGLGLWGQC